MYSRRPFLALLIIATALACVSPVPLHAQETTPPRPPAVSPQTDSPPAAAQTDPAQTPVAPPAVVAPSTAPKGGLIHGSVKSGNIPLPGVSVTATNTLTGKKYATTTDINGIFTMNIPQNGRYVLKTELAAFASVTKEALLNATQHDQAVEFELLLASRAEQAAAKEDRAATRQSTTGGLQNLNLQSALEGVVDVGSLSAAANGAALPSIASNTDFGSNESVAVSGQQGVTNPLASIDFNQLRDAVENAQAQGGGLGGGGQGVGFGGGPVGGGPGGGFGGGFGGPGGGGEGQRIQFRGNFRNFKPNQPHGAFFWSGSNSALNASPFSVTGIPQVQPASGSNRFGLTFAGAPYIPKLMKQASTKDFMFLTLSGQRSSSPQNFNVTVPTAAERAGDFSGLTGTNGALIPIYDPGCYPGDPNKGKPFPGNVITTWCTISSQAKSLLNYIPLPNLTTGDQLNYQLLTTAQTNSTAVGARFVHNFGPSGSTQLPAFLAQFSNQKGLRQNVNANFNYSHSASDRVNVFPELGGKLQSNQYSLTLGYTIGYGRLNNNFNIGWNRSNSQTTNFFTDVSDISTELGILGPDGAPINPTGLGWGLPSVSLTQFAGLSETQANFRINESFSFSESSSWTHAKHNIRFGGDARRVHLTLLGGGNLTGSFAFTGLATQQPGTGSSSSGGAQSGSSIADLLLSLPQSSNIQSPQEKVHMRANVWDLYAQDDWRVLANLTLLYGIRYEYFSPYSEENNRLSTLDPNSTFTSVVPVYPNTTGPYGGYYGSSLINPYRTALAPRIGFALRPLKNTVLRGGYGINFTQGQYGSFITNLAYQPPFANVQTNLATQGAKISLADGFPSPMTVGNYSVNKSFALPYVQTWNLNLQRTIPLGIVLNANYTGSKGTHLDIQSAPAQTAQSSASGVYFKYENAVAFSNQNAFSFSAQKRLQKGISLRASYTYGHSIDNAFSIGATGSTVVAQNWQNLLAEEGNSSFDVRHKVTGTYLYELPFGPDKYYLNSGNWLSHLMSGLSISGDFTFATGLPLTPNYSGSALDVARNTAGSLRPDRVPGSSLTAGGGTLQHWFNTAAFAAPAGPYGTASRYSIRGPGVVSNDMSLSRTQRLGDTRSFEVRASANNVFNTVQYSGVDTSFDSRTYGQVISAAAMRSFNFSARFRY